MWKRYSIRLLLAAAFLALTAGTTMAGEASPTDVLRKSVDGVIEVLTDDKVELTEKRGLVVKLVRERFDFTAMSRFIVGKHWRKATQDQRDDFVERFTRILEHTYIGRIEAYSGEKVRYLTEDIRKGKAKVETLVVGGSAEIPINYKLYQKEGEWLVYDVSVEGVSLVRNYKDTYAGIIRKEGLDGLLEKMLKKAEELENGEQG